MQKLYFFRHVAVKLDQSALVHGTIYKTFKKYMYDYLKTI